MKIEKLVVIVLITILSSLMAFTNAFAQVVIADANLKAYIQYVLGLETNAEITQEKADTLTTLNAIAIGITSLDGIEYLTNLKVADFSGNDINDVSPLMKLRYLTNANLRGNKLSDVNPFNDTMSVKPTVDITDNCIKDFSPIDDNLLEPVILVGRDIQRATCDKTQTVLYNLSVYPKNDSTGEIEFSYRGWNNVSTACQIDFGDGQNAPAVCDGYTNTITHKYSGNGPFTAKLTLNDKVLQIVVETVFYKPVLITPSDGGQVYFGSVQFTWNPVKGATEYQFNILKENGDVFLSKSGIKTTSLTLGTELNNNTAYKWRVRALSVGNVGTWSDVRRFTVITQPAPVTDTGTTDWTSYADSAAAFTMQPITGNAPLTVSYDTQGTIGDISFDYGDGTTGKALSHTYTQPGTYKVVLTATGISGYKTLMEKTVTVTQAPCVATANFTAQPENGQAPLSVSLNTDGSTGELSFDYGDGTTGKELSHTYSQPGTYTIILTTTGIGGCKNTMQKTITVDAPCIAAPKIKATPASGTVPFTVSFDASESQGQTYQWDFGDGSTATGQIQSHTYTNPGTYAVVLTVKGTDGCTNSANMTIEALPVSKPTITMTSEREFQAGNYKEPPAKVIWEIFTDTMTVFRAETTGLSLKLPELFLNKDTDYQCRMMSVDSKGNLSAWSEPLAFKVSTPDTGIQTGVLKIETVNRNDTLLSLKYFDSQTFSDSGKPAYLPYGLTGFRLKTSPGAIAQVIIRFPEAVASDAKWYRYDEINSRYEEYSHAVFAQDRKAITVEIRDGGFGDADGVENGIIVFSPSGYGTSTKTITDAVVQPIQTDDGGGCFINSVTSGLPSWFSFIILIAFAFLLCIRKIQNT